MNEDFKHEGYMLRKKENSNKYKKYWYSLLDKELYVYKHRSDAQHAQMYNLFRVFVKEEELIKHEEATLYPFTLIFDIKKRRTFYVISEVKKPA